jgi:hypothetical protein
MSILSHVYRFVASTTQALATGLVAAILNLKSGVNVRISNHHKERRLKEMEFRRFGWVRAGTLLLFASITIFLSGCRNSNAASPTIAVEIPATALQAPTPTATTSPGAVVFVQSEAAARSSQQEEVQALEQLAAGRGLIFQIVQADELNAALAGDARFVLLSTPTDGISQLAEANPRTGFVAVGPFESGPRNLYWVRPLEDLNAEVGFISGYTAAMVTPNYRVGGIAVSGDGRENAALQGFLNGAVFYCGLCRAAYPPFNDYPQSVLAASTEPDDVLSSIRQLLDLGVSTIYLSPRLSNEDVFEALQPSGARYIGSAYPNSQDGIKWLATIAPDKTAALLEAWDAWWADEPGYVINPPLGIRKSDEEIMTPGKLEYLENILRDLSSGRIDPAIDPQTGKSK